MVYFRENYDFPRFQRGSNIFQCVCVGGGGGGGGGKVQMLISIETHITCDFPGRGRGVRTLYPPSGSTQHEFITDTSQVMMAIAFLVLCTGKLTRMNMKPFPACHLLTASRRFT